MTKLGRCKVGLTVAVATAGASWSSVAIAQASQLSVCASGCPYSQPADAIAAAHDGDQVVIGRGSYAGGFTIDKSITVSGAGPGRTTIRGGGPVITVGVNLASSEPTVTLRGLTITGGLAQSTAGTAFEALGGGVFIPPSTGGGVGATVTILDSDITGNTVAPETSIDAGPEVPCSDTSDCQFAHAGGGGIDSWGQLTVANSVISNNAATGPFTSDANGAGIYGQQGTLTVEHSLITRNQAIAGPTTGRFAEGAAIMFDTFFSGGCDGTTPACQVTIRDSTVSDNRSTLTTNLPSFAQGELVSDGVNAGGIHIGDAIPTTVSDTNIIGNTASSTNPNGEATAIDAGMLVGDSPLTMQDVRVIGNQTLNRVATSADIGPGGSTLELDGPGTLSHLLLLGNLSRETSQDGLASDAGAFAVFNFTGDPEPVTVQDSVISGNDAEAGSATGQATVQGSGVFNNSLLTLDGVTVSGNVGRANGTGGFAQGGGIWNGVDLSGPPVELSLEHTAVVRNALLASPGIEAQGGGLYTTSPVTLDHALIAGNRPDQCVGCSLSAVSPAPNALRAPSRAGRTSRRSAARTGTPGSHAVP
jgi:hypothetical protein